MATDYLPEADAKKLTVGSPVTLHHKPADPGKILIDPPDTTAKALDPGVTRHEQPP